MMMRKFKFLVGITDNSFVFHAGFPQAIPVSIGERTTHVASIQNETTDDLSHYHGIDAEAELTRILLNEITTELTENWNGGHRA
jgi:hypothetical protein